MEMITPTSQNNFHPHQESFMSLIAASPQLVVPCSREAYCVSGPSTFGWGDIPVVGDTFSRSLPAYSPSMSFPDYDEEYSDSDDSGDDDGAAVCTPPSPRSTAISPCELQVTSRKTCGNKSVRLASFVEVREYVTTLGDHPCCTGGMALQCDWEYSESEFLDFEVFEATSRKRGMAELRLSYGERRRRLQACTGKSGSELLREEYALICGAMQDNYQGHLRHANTVSQSLNQQA